MHYNCKKTNFQIKGYKYITKRIINDTNRLKFNEQISKNKYILSFQATNKSEPNLETRYNNYFDQISTVYNQCFPMVTQRIHTKTLGEPW